MAVAEKPILELLASGNFKDGLGRYAVERERRAVSAMLAAKTWEDHQKAAGAHEEAGKLRQLADEIEQHEAARNVALKK